METLVIAAVCVRMEESNAATRKETETMKTKILWAAVLASAVMIAQANAGGYRAGGGDSHGGAVAHAAPAAPVPARASGFSSMRSIPTRSFGGRMIYPGRRYSSI